MSQASTTNAPIIPLSASISPLMSVTQHASNIHSTIIPSSASISPLMSVTQHASNTIIQGSQVLQQSISFLCNQFSGVPAPIKKVQNPLPSTAITETLASVTSTLSKYEKLQTECRAPTLAVKLAKESLFGDQVMKQCTVMGAKTQPALPLKELNELKSIIFGLFPKYRNSPFQFETLWMKCVDALGHACRRLRRLPA